MRILVGTVVYANADSGCDCSWNIIMLHWFEAMDSSLHMLCMGKSVYEHSSPHTMDKKERSRIESYSC